MLTVTNLNNPMTTIMPPNTLRWMSETLWENFADESPLLLDEVFIDFRSCWVAPGVSCGFTVLGAGGRFSWLVWDYC